MRIVLTRAVAPDLTLAVEGETLILNGARLDLSAATAQVPIPLDTLADWPWLASDVTRVEGVLQFTLIAPYAGGALPHSLWDPDPLTVTGDGPVALPDWTLPDGGGPLP